MGNIVRFPVNILVSNYGVTHFIETGYGKGVSCKAAVAYGFTKVLSCEIYPPLHKEAIQNEQFSVALANSIDFIKSDVVISTLEEQRCLIFLDAHYPGADFGFEEYKSTNWESNTKLPLLDELKSLRGKCDNSVIIVDDCRIYIDDLPVYSGPMGDIADNAFDKEIEFINSLIH